jgi:hypothetical protein
MNYRLRISLEVIPGGTGIEIGEAKHNIFAEGFGCKMLILL